MANKFLRKIYISTTSFFIILTVITINIISKETYVKPTVNINKLSTNRSIYLVNEKKFLIKYDIYLNENSPKKEISKIINLLTETTPSKFPNKISGIIPKNTKILDIFIGQEYITLNFSKELLNVNENMEKQMIQGIVYSLCDKRNVKKINILVEGQKLLYYPNSKEKIPPVLNKSIGINVIYDINSIKNIENVKLYYAQSINDKLYYVPVTKYLNDKRDKIEIIIEELSKENIDNNELISYINYNTRLIDFYEDSNILTLNFNEYLLEDQNIMNRVYDLISYSVFANYDVDMIMFQINGNNIKAITKV